MMVGFYTPTMEQVTSSLNTRQKKGKVTVRGKPSETIEQEILNSIWKQAGWK